MMMFQKKKKIHDFDRDRLKPVLRRSICTGEISAGFADRKSGRFEEVMLIKDEDDLRAFMAEYGLDEKPEIIY